MRHFQTFEEVQLTGAWVTIGAFDGVHRGHQAILAPLAREAHAAGSPAVVVTFFPHPAVVLRGLQGAHYLTTPSERAALLGALGIDAVLTLTFDRALAALSAHDFMQKLRDHLGLRQLWVGYDFALGRDRQGDIPTLRRLGEAMGYSVHVIPEITNGGGAISSSQVRALLREGRAAEAARLLGRPYRLRGEVVHGDARGRRLGIPTANLAAWPGKIVPASGVYATWAWVPAAGAAQGGEPPGEPPLFGGRRGEASGQEPDPAGQNSTAAGWEREPAGQSPAAEGWERDPAGQSSTAAGWERVPAVTNIGLRPTFEGQEPAPRVEAHLLHFDRDLYGQEIALDFLEFLRPEQRFPSVDALLAQIASDIERANEVFAHAA